MNVLLLFSLFGLDGPLSADSAMRDRLILFGAIFLVVIAVAASILLRRALKRHRSRRHGRSRGRHSVRRTVAGMAELKQTISERSRRRRRVHRSRNPTLAETGGLPPLRSDEPRESPQPRTQPQ
jgi:type VI protein secretion system component VasK